MTGGECTIDVVFGPSGERYIVDLSILPPKGQPLSKTDVIWRV